MGNSAPLALALATLGVVFEAPAGWEPDAETGNRAAPLGTENSSPDQSDVSPVPTVPLVPTEIAMGSRRLEDGARVAWGERAAILEYDGGFDRAKAEALATAELGYRPPTP